MSIDARTGSDLPTPRRPRAAGRRPDDPGTGLAPPAGTAAAGALLAGIDGVAGTARGARAWAPEGRPTPWAGPDASTSWIRVDEKELAAMATTEFARRPS